MYTILFVSIHNIWPNFGGVLVPVMRNCNITVYKDIDKDKISIIFPVHVVFLN